MAHPRTFRVGVQLSTASSGDDWAGLARKAEDLGYSTLFLPDHFGGQLAPVPAMMAAADATTELRVGCLVFDNDYKHPVVLAKEVATIDVLSGGRVELGIGAGWMNSDYEQSGIPHDTAGVRIDRME
jgi:probable F420-dependent oxidoreductase